MQFSGSPGLILPGGGARAAYQVGVLKAIAAVLDEDRLPFTAISGISAGAINAIAVAQNAASFGDAVEQLEALWGNLKPEKVFLVDYGVFQGLISRKNGSASSLLDNTPLRSLIDSHINPAGLEQSIRSGLIKGLAISASNYSTGEATTFLQADSDSTTWHHDRRDGVLATLSTSHVMASSALPMLFPAEEIDGQYYVDGSLRMTAPLSPAINLGADRILVIGVRNETPSDPADALHPPSMGEIGGYTLESMFSENLNTDLERMQQLNHMLNLIPRWRRRRSGRRQIDVMVIRPSEDLRVIAARFSLALPRGLRLLLRTVGGWGHEWRLPSYLLFDGGFTRALMDLGYRDGLKQRPALEKFFS
ncbi:MAG: patatin-like phospholipase family protein [Proteobacteria bacterium]|nr:patatin-like phospholipase family protein [Pseudomonadota bacterium]